MIFHPPPLFRFQPLNFWGVGLSFGEYYNKRLFGVCMFVCVMDIILGSNQKLGGGLKYVFMFTPTWRRFPIWRFAYVSNGLVQPPTRKRLPGLESSKGFLSEMLIHSWENLDVVITNYESWINTLQIASQIHIGLVGVYAGVEFSSLSLHPHHFWMQWKGLHWTFHAWRHGVSLGQFHLITCHLSITQQKDIFEKSHWKQNIGPQ